jgi:hypothetical protein
VVRTQGTFLYLRILTRSNKQMVCRTRYEQRYYGLEPVCVRWSGKPVEETQLNNFGMDTFSALVLMQALRSGRQQEPRPDVPVVESESLMERAWKLIRGRFGRSETPSFANVKPFSAKQSRAPEDKETIASPKTSQDTRQRKAG